MASMTLWDGMTDLANRSALDIMGEDASIALQTGGTAVLKGVYQRPIQVKDFAGQNVTVTNRTLHFIESEFTAANVQQGDICTIHGVGYTLLNPLPDGNGMVACDLREYAP